MLACVVIRPTNEFYSSGRCKRLCTVRTSTTWFLLRSYGACANAVADACEKTGAELITLQIDRAELANSTQLLARLEAQLATHPHIKFALLDHITSPTAVVLPIKGMCEMCRAAGVKVHNI
eukprot:SAG31_NODE_581_length_13927_cov_78.549899_2_plen_121_part_00